MGNLMPLHFLWSEVERLMDIRGITHRDTLAELTGIHRTNLYKISRGHIKPSFSALGKLCQALRCQPGDLLRFVDADEALARTIAQGVDDKED
jgi:putative transcriptional regulator